MYYGVQTWSIDPRTDTPEIDYDDWYDSEGEALDAAREIIAHPPYESAARVTVGRFYPSGEMADDTYLLDEMLI